MRNELPALMTVAETAAALSVSTKTVRRMLEDGRIVAHRIGTNVRVNASSVMHLLWAPPVPASEQQVQEKDEVAISLGSRLKYTNELTGEIGGVLVPLGTPDELEATSRLRAARRSWNNIAKKKDQHKKLGAASFIVHEKGKPRFIKYKASGTWKSRRIPSEHVESLVDRETAQAYALRWAVLHNCIESGTVTAAPSSSSPRTLSTSTENRA